MTTQQQRRLRSPYLAPLLAWQYWLLSYVFGVLSGENALGALAAWLFLLVAGRERRWPRLAAAALFFCLGAGMAWMRTPPPPAPAAAWMLQKKPALLWGTVTSVEPRSPGSVRLLVDDVTYTPPAAGNAAPFVPLRGRLCWTWYDPAFPVYPGARIAAHLRVRPLRGMANWGVWDYEGWWARQGVLYRAWSTGGKGGPTLLDAGQKPFFLRRWRDALRARVDAALHPHASQGRAVLQALLFGDRSLVSPATRDVFQKAGLAHSLALSGLHVGIVVWFGFVLAACTGRLYSGMYILLPRQKIGVLLGGVFAVVYMWLGGWTPSLLRAGLMFFFWGLFFLRNREHSLMDGLLCALACMAALNPESLSDVRLQLSMAAVAGIAVYLESGAPLALTSQDRERGARGFSRTVPRKGLQLALVSLAAQLALMPLLVWQFGELPCGVIWNVAWLPVLGVVVLPLGLLGLLASLLPWSAPAAWLFSAAAWPTEQIIGLLHWLHEHGLLPVLYPLRPGWPAWLGYWGAFILLAMLVRRLRRDGERGPQPLRTYALAAMCTALLALPGIKACLHVFERGVTLRMLDVGQGQALLLELPRGRRLLLDGGGFPFGNFDIGEAIISPLLRAHRAPFLEWMLLSHADSDHSLGLVAPLAQCEVGYFGSNGRLPQKGGAARLTAAVRQRAKPGGHVLRAGDGLSLGDGVFLEVLHPGPGFEASGENECSLAVRLVWEGRGLALLPGDVQRQGAVALLRCGACLRAEALVLPHHGSWFEGLDELLRAVRPRYALASVGYCNRYNFPDKRTLLAVRRQGTRLLTTAGCGAVSLRWSAPQQLPELRSVRAACSSAFSP